VEPFLKWIDRLRQAGGPVAESEESWTVDVPLGAGFEGVRAQVLGPYPVSGTAVGVEVRADGVSLPYLLPDGDVALAGGLKLCDRHQAPLAELLQRQNEGLAIAPGERLAALATVAACPDCRLPLRAHLSLDKREAIISLLAQRGQDWPETVSLRCWLEPGKPAYALREMLQWPQRPVLLVVRGALDLGSNFVLTVNVEDPHVWDALLMGKERLQAQAEVLGQLLERRGTAVVGDLHLLPPDYWISDSYALRGRLADALLAGFHGRELFALSILAYGASRVERRGDQLLFTLDRENPQVLTLDVGADALWHAGQRLDLSPHAGAMVSLYAAAIHNRPLRSNRTLLQTAVVMAGGGNLLALLTQAGTIAAYYSFEYQALFEARFEQQVGIARGYAAQLQEAHNQVSAAIGGMNQNLATIATALGALALLLLTQASKADNALGDYLVFSGLVLCLLYLPAYGLWVHSVAADLLTRLQEFAAHVRWSAQTLDYPLERLELPERLRVLTGRVRGSLLRMAAILGCVHLAGAALFWYGFVHAANWLRTTLGAGWLAPLLGLMLALLLGFAAWYRALLRSLKQLPTDHAG